MAAAWARLAVAEALNWPAGKPVTIFCSAAMETYGLAQAGISAASVNSSLFIAAGCCCRALIIMAAISAR
jgi:hypothetical protein